MAISTCHLRYRQKVGTAAGLGLLSIALGACVAEPPKCVEGKEAPTSEMKKLWQSVSEATQIDLGIDGSASMLGLMGSAEATATWQALIQGVSLSAAEENLPIKTKRVGGGRIESINNPSQAIEECFFRGCGQFLPVSSSLHSLWQTNNVIAGNPPIKVLISDMEVNNKDISSLIGSIRPHIDAGAVIGVLALKAPFKGKVYKSDASVIHTGEASRPIYIIATGPRSQIHQLLQSIKENTSIANASSSPIKLVKLEDWVNQKTLTAKSVTGEPSQDLISGLNTIIGNKKYGPSRPGKYQFAKIDEGIKIINLASKKRFGQNKPTVKIGRLETIQFPDIELAIDNIKMKGISINGSDVQMTIQILKIDNEQALRAVIPRGQLPQNWWVEWDRQSTESSEPQNQTDGLLRLMTSLGKLLVDPKTTPAVSFCLLTNS